MKRGPEEIEWVRAMIEARPNHALERAGSAERVDRRSLFEQRAPLGTVTRLQANNDRRQLTADRAELGAVSAQIIDIEQAREQATGAASAGMEAFKARFQQSQDVAARIEAERARLTAEAQRVAQERAAEQAAQEREQEQERAAKAQKHAALSNAGPVKRGRSGPDFSM